MPGSILRTSPFTRMHGGAPATRSKSLAPRPTSMASQWFRRSVTPKSSYWDYCSRSMWSIRAESFMWAPVEVALWKVRLRSDLDAARGNSPVVEIRADYAEDFDSTNWKLASETEI